MKKDLTALIIMDGYGIGRKDENNAIFVAKKPRLDAIMNKYPTTSIECSGLAVGLPVGQMGNSEVGHLNLGAGRIINQPLVRVTKAIDDGSFFENPALVGAMENVVKHDSSLHLMGLVSDGGVHSHTDHLLALVEMAKKSNIKKVFIHAYMDGRDVPPSSGKDFIIELEEGLARISLGKIATVSGRFYAMDRDNIWERVSIAYNAIVTGEGQTADNAADAMQNSYDKGETDEFVKPTVVMEDGSPTAVISENDSVIFYNFRPDRARQLTRSFIDPDFDGFERSKGYFPLKFVSLTTYDETFENIEIAFKPISYDNTFGEYISGLGLKQLRIAETQKYPHVTYFFNGGVEAVNPGEDRVMIDSPKIETFDLMPEMSAYEVTDEAVKRILSGKYDVVIMNYANCDMVGHTGIIDAAVASVETVDECVGRIIDAVQEMDGRAIITSDHGNAEQMYNPITDGPYTAHTVYTPVPFVIVDDNYIGAELYDDGKLGDVIPTMLDLMDIEKPAEMTGKSLIKG